MTSVRYLILIIIACLLTSCRPGGQKVASERALHLIVNSAPEALDPRYASSAVAENILQLIYAPLFLPGDDLLPKPFLAAGYTEHSPTAFLIHLRPDAYFHDGTPISAEDVVYTFGELNSTDVNSPHAAKFKYIRQISALGPHLVRFELKEPYAPFLLDLCGMGIVSKKSCSGRSQQCRFELNGSGPFRVAKYHNATDKISLQPNPKWFTGAPKLPEIDIRVVRDPTTRLLELIKGKADMAMAGAILPIQLPALDAYRGQLNVYSQPGLGYGYIGMNLRGPRNPSATQESEQDRTRRALAHQDVRRALALAINVDEIIVTKFRGKARRASGMIPDGHWAKASGLRPLPYDPQLAQKLLDRAGFYDRGRRKHGRFRLTISATPDRFRQSIALIYAHAFRQIGVDVSVRVQDWASLYQDIKQGNFEMFSAMWTPVLEPDLLHWVFHSENIPSANHGGGNRGSFRDALIDKWTTEARHSDDLLERKRLYQAIEERLQETLPYIPLWFEDDTIVASKRVKGFRQMRSGSLLELMRATKQ